MRRFILLFVMSLLLSSVVLAKAGMRMTPDEDRIVIFEPGATHEWKFFVHGNEYLFVDKGGDLDNYTEIVDPDPNGGARQIIFRLHLPDALPAGEYDTWARVTESAPEGAMMGGRAAVKGRVTVYSLYDEPFLKAHLEVENAANGTNTPGLLTLKSWSTVTIPESYAVIRVLDAREEVLSIRTESISLEPTAEGKIPFILPTSDLKQGPYEVEATIHYGEQEADASASFRIGALEFRLLSYTKELTADETNKFSFKIESDWKDTVPEVYGVVTLLGFSEQTATIEVSPFRAASLKTYLDLDGVEIGTYQGNITLHYAEKTQRFPFEVEVTGEETEAVQVEQTPKESPFNMMLGLYIGLVILIILNIVLLFWKGRRHDEFKPPGVR